MERVDLSGMRFGRLLVVSRSDRYSHWVCVCDCGKQRHVRIDHLRTGASKSCGCLAVENSAAAKRKHGQALWSGESPEYRAWRHLRERCYDPRNNRYAIYGARGIVVCDEWRYDFAAFFSHIGERPSAQHSIDRIDVNRGYEPGNVRWATRAEQANNKRSNVNFRDCDGQRLNISQLAAYLAIDRAALTYRLVRAGVL